MSAEKISTSIQLFLDVEENEKVMQKRSNL